MRLVEDDHVEGCTEQVRELWILDCVVPVTLVAAALVIGTGLPLGPAGNALDDWDWIAMALDLDPAVGLVLAHLATVHPLDAHHLLVDDEEARAWRGVELIDDVDSCGSIALCYERFLAYQLVDLAKPDRAYGCTRCYDED